MTSHERREMIMQHIREHGSGTVDEFTERFQVSAVTIRHDLNLLEKKGCLFRHYGGASLNPHFAFDQPLHHKGQLNRSVKDQIARAAANLVQDGESIILDSGSTISCMPAYLESKQHLVVMTNALNTAYQLSGFQNIDLHVVGGNLRRASCSLIGSHGEQQILDHHFDKLFLGVDGFDLEAGVTTPDQNEARINRAFCKAATRVIAVTDSSKFGRKSFCLIRSAEQIDILVTDSQIPDEYYRALSEKGVQIILADKEIH